MENNAKQHKALLVVISLSGFLTGFDYTALNIAIPELAHGFQSTYSITSWVLLAYALVFTAFAMPAGNLIGLFGARRLLTTGFLIYAIGSILCVFATGILPLIGFRIIQGIGGVILFVSGPALVRLHMGHETRGFGYSIAALAPTIGIFSGPALGSFILSEFGWRWIFALNMPICVAGIVIVASISGIRAPRRAPKRHIDTLGSLLLFGGLGALVLALNQGTELGWTSHLILIAFGIAICCLSAFITWELYSPQAAFDLRLLTNAVFCFGALAVFLYLLMYGGLNFSFPIYLNQIKDLSIATTGRVMAFQPLTILGMTFAVGAISGVLSSRKRIGLGVSLMLVSMTLALQDDRATGLWLMVLVFITMGMAQSFFLPAVLEITLEAVAEDRAAQASGVLTTLRAMGQMLGVVVFETVLSNQVGINNAEVTPTQDDHNSFLRIFWLAAFVPLFIAACAFAQTRKRSNTVKARRTEQ